MDAGPCVGKGAACVDGNTASDGIGVFRLVRKCHRPVLEHRAIQREVATMQVPPEVKPACWGAIGGAIAVAIIGFTWGGWVTGGTAETMAKERADAAVVKALAPVCVDNFRQAVDAKAQQLELKNARSWERASFVEKHGWATMPGSSSPHPEVARACAELITNLKL
jgi:hypothetical protein